VFGEIVDRHLAIHPAIRRNPDWATAAAKAATALNDLYQADRLANTSKRNRPCTSGGSSSGSRKPSRSVKIRFRVSDAGATAQKVSSPL
jgi:hypothetical protein